MKMTHRKKAKKKWNKLVKAWKNFKPGPVPLSFIIASSRAILEKLAGEV